INCYKMLQDISSLPLSSTILFAILATACFFAIGVLVFQCTSCCKNIDLYKNFVLDGDWNQSITESQSTANITASQADNRTMTEFGMLPPPNDASISMNNEATGIRSTAGSSHDLAAIVQQKPKNFLRPRMRLSFELVPKSAGVILLPNLLHMDRKHLFFLSELGQAWFGPVIDAECNRYGETLRSRVIVRLLSNEASVELAEKDRLHFLADIQAYKECVDPCVLKLMGLCTTAEPYLAVMETTLTDLKSYLRSLITDGGHRCLEDSLALRFASQACRGLAVLNEKGFIYQDIGARNCRLTDNLVVKIGDYGCTEVEHRDDYVLLEGQLIPLRWLAPENFNFNTEESNGSLKVKDHSLETNVWSMGVVLLEVFTMASQPLSGYTDEQLVNHLTSLTASKSAAELQSFLVSALTADSEKFACQYKSTSQLWQLQELRNRCWSSDRPSAGQLFDQIDKLFKLASSTSPAVSSTAAY
ncbi:hypothetical protein BOX15_Mlig013395g1, partial [Macrostomum lignano]